MKRNNEAGKLHCRKQGESQRRLRKMKRNNELGKKECAVEGLAQESACKMNQNNIELNGVGLEPACMQEGVF